VRYWLKIANIKLTYRDVNKDFFTASTKTCTHF